MFFSILIIIILICIITLPLIMYKSKLKKYLPLVIKIMAIAIFSLGVFRHFLNDSFLRVINGGEFEGVYYQTHDVIQSLLRWGITLSFVVYPCAAFFNIKTFKNIAIYFCLPISIISLFFYNNFINYFIEPVGHGFYMAKWFRHLEFSLELILLIVIPLLLRFALDYKFDVKNKSEWKYFAIFLPLTLLVCIPVTMPQSLFGYTKFVMRLLSLPHIIWIISIISLFIGIYFAFRNTNKEVRYSVCIFLSLFLFYHYNSMYLMGLQMRRLPLQLCNLGSYFVLISLLIKKKPFFDFVFLANVPGALIAFLAPSPDVNQGVFSYWGKHFYIEHTWVFVIPLLAVAFKLFERPDKKSIKHFFIGFSIYFAVCAILGVIANCFLMKPGSSFFNSVNYFYLFDNTVVDILPFLKFTKNVAVTWSDYTFYPLYMVVVYILFGAFSMAIMGICKLIYKICDKYFKSRTIEEAA